MEMNNRIIDVNSETLSNRVIYLTGEVETFMAEYICKALIYLDNLDGNKPIQMFINSPGGSVLDGLAIINTMNAISAPVYTCVNGLAASMGAAILSAGEIGHRYAYPKSKVMVHQVSSGMQGTVQDLQVSYENTQRLNDELAEMIAENCGQTKKAYLKACDRDHWMTADESLQFGIIDEVLTNTDKSKRKTTALKERFGKKK